ncbi:MAG TPA: hypothetical protein VET27_27030 [Mycobacterium sp.]|nr:hypothetical protein [Mycobacterium sp.]
MDQDDDTALAGAEAWRARRSDWRYAVLATGADLPVHRTLQTAVLGGVATITLNRPGVRNAIGDGMRDELADAYLRFATSLVISARFRSLSDG